MNKSTQNRYEFFTFPKKWLLKYEKGAISSVSSPYSSQNVFVMLKSQTSVVTPHRTTKPVSNHFDNQRLKTWAIYLNFLDFLMKKK